MSTRSVYDKGAAACAVDAYLTHRVHALGHVMQTFLCVRWGRACHHVTIQALRLWLLSIAVVSVATNRSASLLESTR